MPSIDSFRHSCGLLDAVTSANSSFARIYPGLADVRHVAMTMAIMIARCLKTSLQIYNRAVMQLLFSKGTLLRFSGVPHLYKIMTCTIPAGMQVSGTLVLVVGA